MKSRVRDIIAQGDKLFSKRSSLMSNWQTMADNFYPMRADFTRSLDMGEEFASHLMSSRPLLAQRDLGNAVSSMLRPRGQTWFHIRTTDERINEDSGALKWLDAKTEVMRSVMYHREAQFLRATKQGDNDFITFGQCVLEVVPNRYLSGLLHRCWHLRDVVWAENADMQIDTVHRKWKLPARDLQKLFRQRVDSRVNEAVKNEPHREFKCRHVVLPADEYDLTDNKRKLPFVSLYVDCENETLLEEKPLRSMSYVIPRWVTVSGSQYAHSPATVTALPDARLLQQMTITLLEAGEKAVDPPLKATQEGIVGAVNTYAGGITWVDHAYDERQGAALEPVIDTSRYNLGWGEMQSQKIEEMIAEAFFLNKIALPPSQVTGDMTKWEGQQRVEEYIRGALPLFEPLEVEYNGALCERVWDLCLEMNIFGPLDDMPQELRGQEIQFTFDSPLQEAVSREKARAFVEASNLLGMAATIDPAIRHDFDLDKAFRDAIPGVGAPADWLTDEEEAGEAKEMDREMMAVKQAAQDAGQVAGDVGAVAAMGAV